MTLLLGILIFALLALTVYAAEEENETTEVEEVSYETVGQMLEKMSEVDGSKRNQVTKALSSLFSQIATHLGEKDVPDHVVKKFEERSESVVTLGNAGLLSSDQMASEASRIVESVGKEDSDGKVPTAVLEKAGMSKEDAKKLSKEGVKGLNVAKAAQKMAQSKKQQQKQETVEEETRSEEKKRKTKKEQSQIQKTKEEKVEERNQEKGESSRAKKENPQAQKKENVQTGKPENTPGNGQSKGQGRKAKENASVEEAEASSVDTQEVKSPDISAQEEKAPGNSGNNPGNSGEKGNSRGKPEEKNGENPGGKGKEKGKGRSGE